MALVLSHGPENYGSHGMQARRYGAMLEMIAQGRMNPGALVGRSIGLDEAAEALVGLGSSPNLGITVITHFTPT